MSRGRRSGWKIGVFAASLGLAGAHLVVSSGRAVAAEPEPPVAESAADRAARMAWWREARFGLFIHWGVYSVAGGEWKGRSVQGVGEWIMESGRIPVSDYESLATQFNPVKYDPAAWASLARDAGCRYVIITSKHHDGFALFDSEVSDWEVRRTPWGRDLLIPLADAVRAQGLKFGVYFSIMDWHHQDYEPRRAWNDAAPNPPQFGRFVEFVNAQVSEVVTRLDPAVLWFDGEWERTWTSELGASLERRVRSLKHDIIINNRVGKSRDGMAGLDKAGEMPSGDFGTPEQEIPSRGLPGVDWESCMTMNDTWGFKWSDANWKPARELIQNLIETASKGGNYLLNVGPTAEGEIPAESVARLRAIGDWLKVNGDSIYGTSAGPFRSLAWGQATSKGDRLFLHVLRWPTDGRLVVPGLLTKIRSARILGDEAPLGRGAWRAAGTDLELFLPGGPRHEAATVIELQFDGAPKVADLGLSPDAAGVFVLTAERAELSGRSIRVEHRDGPNIGYWTDPAATAEWPLDVSAKGPYRVRLELACTAAEAGDVLALSFGGTELQTRVPSTGAWDAFEWVELPAVVLGPGRTVVRVAATPELRGALMNLREIRLEPVKD